MPQPARGYSGPEPISLELVQKRVLLVLNLYDKIDNDKVIMIIGVIDR